MQDVKDINRKYAVGKLWARLLETLSLVFYLAAIINAQFTLGDYVAPETYGGGTEFSPPRPPRIVDPSDLATQIRCWIIIEIAAFCGHMIASVCFIAYKNILRTFFPNKPKEEARKNIDMLRYSYENELHWYIFNFMLCFTPIPLIII